MTAPRGFCLRRGCLWDRERPPRGGARVFVPGEIGSVRMGAGLLRSK